MDRITTIIGDSLMPLLRAFVTVTIPLTLISFAIGLVIALATAVARTSSHTWLSRIAAFYVWVFRGTPLLVQLFIVFFGLPSAGIQLNAQLAAVITFSLNTGAYASESIRAALLAILQGQRESAESLGLSWWQILTLIVVPQAFKIALPSLGNNFVSLVKDTSLAASITVVEVFMTAQRIAARTYEPLLLYVMVAIYYLLFCSLINVLQSRVEKSLAYY